MTDKVLSIRVPGSTSNLGAGFDSIGLALNRYLCLEATESEEWFFQLDSPMLHGVPEGKDNMIYQTAFSVAREHGKPLPPCKINVTSDIPLARGLGSSAAAIIAGIELADSLLNLRLTKKEKLSFASQIEGHADNVAASLLGGLVITTGDGSDGVVTAGAPEIEMVATIPSFELKTAKSRSVLPETLSFKQAAKGSGVANVMIAAMLQKDWAKAGGMMSRDVFHQPFRLPLVPHFQEVSCLAESCGAFGTAISGAGPALICFTARGQGDKLRTALNQRFSEFNSELVSPAENGLLSEVKIKTPSR